MSYHYESERAWIFTEEGQVAFLKVRDHVQALLRSAGAVRQTEALRPVSGDGWKNMALLDRLVELKELREITDSHVAGQDRVFVKGGYSE